MTIKISSIAIAMQCFFYLTLHAQETAPVPVKPIAVRFQFNVALNVASGKEIKEIYGPGYSLGLGLVIKSFTDRLWISPCFDGTYFGNHYDDAIRDDLWMANLGTTVAWNFPFGKAGSTSLAPELGGFYVFGDDNFRPRKNYTGDPIHVYSLRGFAFRPGISIVKKHWKLTASYHLCKVKGKLDELLKNSIETEAWGERNPPIYQMYFFPDQKFDMSYFQLSNAIIF